MYQYQELTPNLTRLSTSGPWQDSGFGRFMYQYQELTPNLTPNLYTCRSASEGSEPS
jgi:hypothetical protein